MPRIVDYKKRKKKNTSIGIQDFVKYFYIDRFASLIDANTKFNIYEGCYRCVVQENLLIYELRTIFGVRLFFRIGFVFFLFYLCLLGQFHKNPVFISYFYKIDSFFINMLDPLLFFYKNEGVYPEFMTETQKFALDFEFFLFVAFVGIISVYMFVKDIKKYIDWRFYEHAVDMGYGSMDFLDHIFQTESFEDREAVEGFRNDFLDKREVIRLRKLGMMDINGENKILENLDEKYDKKAFGYLEDYNDEQAYFIYGSVQENLKDFGDLDTGLYAEDE